MSEVVVFLTRQSGEGIRLATCLCTESSTQTLPDGITSILPYDGRARLIPHLEPWRREMLSPWSLEERVPYRSCPERQWGPHRIVS